MYWHIGKRIFEEEQLGKDRTDYGTYLIKFLSEALQPEYGSGFSYRQLNWYRQFYRTFPIVSALRTQLSWTQYKLLLSVDSQYKLYLPSEKQLLEEVNKELENLKKDL